MTKEGRVCVGEKRLRLEQGENVLLITALKLFKKLHMKLNLPHDHRCLTSSVTARCLVAIVVRVIAYSYN